MKKVILVVAIAGLAMASCKKDRICSCTVTSSYTAGSTTINTTTNDETTFKEVSKRTAKSACISRKASDSNSSYSAVCELK